jgi:hypothetical protein
MVDQSKPFGWDRAAIEMAADVARSKLVNVTLELNGSITVSPLSKGKDPAREVVRKLKSEAPSIPENQPEKVNMLTLRFTDSEEWERRFVKTPLGKRELSALSELAHHGIDDEMDEDLFTSFGPNTARRLWLRGMIDFKLPEDRLEPAKVWLTEAGKAAIEAVRQKSAKKDARKAAREESTQGW